jgi:DNA topoisomerase-3
MGKMLVICEERSIADALTRALGGPFVSEPTQFEGRDHVITWTEGRLAELAGPEVYDASLETWRIEDLPVIPEQFLVVARAGGASATEQLKAIRTLVRRRDIDRLVNACDPGPEGELTFSLLMELVQAGDRPVQRAWLSSLTRAGIRAAFADLRPAGELHPLEEAARARAEADWLIGVNATRAATVRARALGGRITLGRVLTPMLAEIVRRERELEAFTPASYEVVVAAFESESGSARYLGRLAPRPESGSAVEHVRGAVGVVREITVSNECQPAPALHDLAALQDETARSLGFTAKRTADAARECWLHGALTYPRTASRCLPSELAGELREIAAHVGRAAAAYRDASAYVQALDELPLERVIGAQHVGAQHALIPTNAKHQLGLLGDDARRVYDIVARRFLAAFFPPAVVEGTVVLTWIEGNLFDSSGRVLRQPGWHAAYDELPSGEGEQADAGFEQELPELREGDQVRCARIETRERETRPSARFDDASLLASVGGAADAATIERLIELAYVTRDGRALRPTARGAQVIDLLGEHAITSSEPLRRFEERLAQMAGGAESRERVMHDVESFTRELVEHLRELPEERTRFPRRDLGIVCPRCGEGTLIENRKGFGCSTWTSREEPGCGFVIWKSIAGRQITEEIVRELVSKGRTGELAGFRSRAGRAFSAALVLEPTAEQPVTFSFEPRRGATGRTRA